MDSDPEFAPASDNADDETHSEAGALLEVQPASVRADDDLPIVAKNMPLSTSMARKPRPAVPLFPKPKAKTSAASSKLLLKGMYLKQIRIRNFRQYRDDTIFPKPLSPANNLILGANGGGKSNLLQAILFVISANYDKLSSEQREQIFYDGPEAEKEPVAFVELTFAPAPDASVKKGLVLSRTMGDSVDTYLLDGQTATRAKVRGIMKDSGLDLNENPFYFIQQNKVQDIARMTPEARLEMLERCSGAFELDSRIRDADTQLKKHDVNVATIEKQLASLNERRRTQEVEDVRMREYFALETEVAITEGELLRRNYNRLSVAYESKTKALEEQQVKMAATTDKIAEVSNEILKTEQEIAVQKDALSKLNFVINDEYLEHKKTLREEINKCTLKWQNVLKVVAEADQQALYARQEELEDKIQKTLEALKAEDAPDPIRARSKLEAAEAQKSVVEQKLSKYDAPGVQIAIKRRKAYIQAAREKQLISQQKMAALEQEEADAWKQKAAFDEEEKRLSRLLNSDAFDDTLLQNNVLTGMEELRALLKEKRALQVNWDKAHEQEGKARVGRLKGTPVSMRSALHKIQTTFSDKYKLRVILESITLKHSVYRAAVEIAAGNKLFYLVVDDNAATTDIIGAMKKGKWGQVEIVPLQHARGGGPYTYPEEDGVTPMLDVIEAPAELKPVLEQIWGQFVICADLQKCKDVSSRFDKLHCITLSGDRISPDGIVHGGYEDGKKYTRIENSMKERAALQEMAKYKSQMDELDGRIAMQDDIVKKAKADLQNLHNKETEVQSQLAQILAEHLRIRNRLVELGNDVANACARLAVEEKEIADHQNLVDLATTASDTVELTKELNDVNEEICRLKNEMQTEQAKEEETRRRRIALLATADGNKKEVADIEEKIALLTLEIRKADALRTDIDEKQEQYDRITAEHEEAAFQFKAVQTEVEKLCEKKEDLVATNQSLCFERQRLQSSIDQKADALKALAVEKEAAYTAVENNRITPLDVKNRQHKTNKDLRSEHHKLRTRLREYGHIDVEAKTSFDALVKFIKEVEEELEAYKPIKDNLQVLKQYLKKRRTTAVDAFFHNFAEEFTRIFRSLAGPSTQGRVYRESRQAASYGSVVMAIDFGTGVRKNEQLSGGQKTLVALSQILAIQKLESAPLIFFDEVDAALDDIYKRRLAAWLSKDVNRHAQVIMTSHSPDMVPVSKSIFHVYTQNNSKISRLQELSPEDAQGILEQVRREVDTQESSRARHESLKAPDHATPLGMSFDLVQADDASSAKSGFSTEEVLPSDRPNISSPWTLP